MKIFISLLTFLIPVSLFSQNGDNVFNFLRIATSTRAAALGGHNISLVVNDPNMIFHNPALLGPEMDMSIALSYSNYISDINMGSAVFTKAIHDRAAWGAGIQFMGYGDFKQTLPDNTVVGDFSAKDLALDGFFAYDLSDRWRGGVTGKFIYSAFESYTSVALAVDLGVSYYNPDKGFAAAMTFKNLGGQLKAYTDERVKIPWDIQLGITQKLAHAPFRLSITTLYLNKWKFEYIDEAQTDGQEDRIVKEKFGRVFFNHFIFGLDFVPSENFWLGIGFNPKVNGDMKRTNGGGFGGFTAGGGISIKRFDVGFSYLNYYPSAASFMVSLSVYMGRDSF
ncbi:MAG: type IX secretion system protein PorQ [Bacteroidales bacterium]|nr:type IX secretion system protein PorQ [Bacteroidales bacterium]